jgi:hypothetical protein
LGREDIVSSDSHFSSGEREPVEKRIGVWGFSRSLVEGSKGEKVSFLRLESNLYFWDLQCVALSISSLDLIAAFFFV